MPDKDIKVRKRIYRAELGAYLLIVTIAALGFWVQGNQQDALERSQQCTEQFLGVTGRALSERTQYSTDQADANIDLQQAQLRFISVLLSKSHTEQQGSAALSQYFMSLREYTRLTTLMKNKADTYPYPTVEGYRACLNGGK